MKTQPILAAMLGIALAASPAAAALPGEVVVIGRSADLPSAKVQYGDLNLASQAGRERFDRRIGKAATLLCGRTAIQPVSMNMSVKKCHQAVHASAKPQMEALFAAIDNGTQLALNGSGSITASAK